ncbi:MAG: hypothetical protein QM783_11400 [Phycisphaerales bacterium]
MTTLADSAVTTYLPILLLLVAAIGFVVLNLVATKILGPSRHGEVKDMTYESGMNPIGTAPSGLTSGSTSSRWSSWCSTSRSSSSTRGQ